MALLHAHSWSRNSIRRKGCAEEQYGVTSLSWETSPLHRHLQWKKPTRKPQCDTEAWSGNSPESFVRPYPAKRRYMLFLRERQDQRDLAHFLLDKSASQDY